MDPTRAEDFLRFRSSKRSEAAAAAAGVAAGAGAGVSNSEGRRRSSKKGRGDDGQPLQPDDHSALQNALSEQETPSSSAAEGRQFADSLGSGSGLRLESAVAGESFSDRPLQSNLTLFVPERTNSMENKRVSYALDYFGGVASHLTLGSEESDLTFSPATRKRSLSDSNIDSKLTYHSFFSKSASREFEFDKQDLLKIRDRDKDRDRDRDWNRAPRPRATSIAADSSRKGPPPSDRSNRAATGREEVAGQGGHGHGDGHGDGADLDIGLDLHRQADALVAASMNTAAASVDRTKEGIGIGIGIAAVMSCHVLSCHDAVSVSVSVSVSCVALHFFRAAGRPGGPALLGRGRGASTASRYRSYSMRLLARTTDHALHPLCSLVVPRGGRPTPARALQEERQPGRRPGDDLFSPW